MYSRLPGVVYGFHACHKDVFNKVLNGEIDLVPNQQPYHWLGNGIYFWEGSVDRAEAWAREKFGDEGAVLGAIINLGECLNLADPEQNHLLTEAYDYLDELYKSSGEPMPKNHSTRPTDSVVLLRDLDCEVIETLHQLTHETRGEGFDSVRGVFYEGKAVNPGAEFFNQSHVQIAVRNPNCIKGYFKPRKLNTSYRKV